MTDISVTATAAPPAQGRSVSARILADAMRNTGFRVGLAILVIILAASIILPEVTSLSATKISVKEKFLPPMFFGDKWSYIHPLGTDQLGRDLLVLFSIYRLALSLSFSEQQQTYKWK